MQMWFVLPAKLAARGTLRGLGKAMRVWRPKVRGRGRGGRPGEAQSRGHGGVLCRCSWVTRVQAATCRRLRQQPAAT